MGRHNLGAVISFEFLRSVKKKTFWLGTLGVPVVIGIVLLLLILSQSASVKSAGEQRDASITFTFTDGSGMITDELAASYGGTRTTDPDGAIESVRRGDSQAFFAVPADPARDPVRIHGTDLGIFDSGRYSAVAGEMIHQAVSDQIGSPELTFLAGGGSTFSETMYADGKDSGGIFAAAPPLLFLALFYGVVLFLGNQILNSTIEEKENRVTEMILTTLNPTTLITGKIIALTLTGLVQAAVFAVPAAAGYLLAGDRIALPAGASAMLHPEPAAMVTGALLMIGGFALFASSLMAIGAVMPTAKEASGLFSTIVIILFVPLYAASLFASDPGSLIVQVFLYFPFSAPVAAMLLNGLGALSATQAVIVIAELFLVGGLMLAAAVKLFRHGSISYGSKVTLKALWRTR